MSWWHREATVDTDVVMSGVWIVEFHSVSRIMDVLLETSFQSGMTSSSRSENTHRHTHARTHTHTLVHLPFNCNNWLVLFGCFQNVLQAKSVISSSIVIGGWGCLRRLARCHGLLCCQLLPYRLKLLNGSLGHVNGDVSILCEWSKSIFPESSCEVCVSVCYEEESIVFRFCYGRFFVL